MNQIKNATRTLRYTLAVCLSLLLSACNLDKTVDYVDIPSYMGLWYQISANEVSFNEGLVGVTAEYTLLDDGSVEVINTGFQDTLDGPISQIIGNAVVKDTKTNSELKVTFPDVPDFPYPNYLIVLLEENYQYAVVTDPLGYTLFVLSRTPQLDQATYDQILSNLAAKEIDTSKLLLTPQA
jgi:apolipoprotein D and lipocalin family protein